MKMFKKLTCLALALMLILSFAACTEDKETKKDEKPAATSTMTTQVPSTPETPSTPDPVPVNDDAQKVAQYVSDNKSEFESQFEESFSQSSGGITCDCVLKSSGTTIIIDCNINDINNLNSEEKAVFADAFSQLGSFSDSMVELFKIDVPEVTDVKINICEEDGDLITSL